MDIAIIILLCVAIIVGLLNLFKKPKVAIREEDKELKGKIEQEEKTTREVISAALLHGNEAINSGVKANNELLIDNVKNIASSSDNRLAEMKTVLDKQLSDMRKTVEDKLTDMRKTVDEKLTNTLNERLTASFGLISEQLNKVYKSLGEMQEFSTSVTNLERAFTNVKKRGCWGEIMLDNILEETLTAGQYEKQCYVGGKSREAVDFAVVLPGRGTEKVYLPIDVKFPIEDYTRLMESANGGDVAKYAADVTNFEKAIKEQAKSISQKYINPPATTDFAVMYLCTEGLYAEVLRNAGLVEELHTRYKVLPAGPTSVTALLNSLYLGFKTLAVQKSSMEIFKAFQQFQKDFNLFVDNINSAKEQIGRASNTLDSATKRSELIQKRLQKIEGLELPSDEE